MLTIKFYPPYFRAPKNDKRNQVKCISAVKTWSEDLLHFLNRLLSVPFYLVSII